MKIFFLGTLLFFTFLSLHAQDSFKLKFRSRGLFDIAFSDSNKSYYRLEDFRVGFKASYNDIELKVDLGLGGGKLAIKDFLFSYQYKKSIFTFGNAYEPFSIDMLISTADLRFHQSANSVMCTVNGRRIGFTYYRTTDPLFFAIGAYSDNDINKLGSELKQAYAVTSRLILRPVVTTHQLIHVGGAVSYRTPNSDKKMENFRSVAISGCGVTSMFGENIVSSNIDHCKSHLKTNVELLLNYKKVLVQAEYLRNDVTRLNSLSSYRTQGGYAQVCYLLLGKTYNYDKTYAIPERPTGKAVELAARYNIMDMNRLNSELLGGSEKDISLGVNYYAEKYFAIKLNGSYTFVGDHCNAYYSRDFFIAQLRLQYIF